MTLFPPGPPVMSAVDSRSADSGPGGDHDTSEVPNTRNPLLRRNMKQIPDPLVKACQRLTEKSRKGIAGYFYLRETAEKEPLAKLEWLSTFHIFSLTNWGDGRPVSVSTEATFRGIEQALTHASVMLLVLRADRQALESKCKTRCRVTHELVMEVPNKVNSAVAWLNCETATLHKGKAWPQTN